MRKLKYFLLVMFSLLLLLLPGCGGGAEQPESEPVHTEQAAAQEDTGENRGMTDIAEEEAALDEGEELTVEEDGAYTSKEEVALYIHTYGHLPDNFISKTKARKAGWDSSKGNLDEVLPGMSIGGSQFKNYDGKLPDQEGRRWTECDINYQGGYRGVERIIFSNDGLIYYTDDHYQSFEQLY